MLTAFIEMSHIAETPPPFLSGRKTCIVGPCCFAVLININAFQIQIAFLALDIAVIWRAHVFVYTPTEEEQIFLSSTTLSLWQRWQRLADATSVGGTNVHYGLPVLCFVFVLSIAWHNLLFKSKHTHTSSLWAEISHYMFNVGNMICRQEPALSHKYIIYHIITL